MKDISTDVTSIDDGERVEPLDTLLELAHDFTTEAILDALRYVCHLDSAGMVIVLPARRKRVGGRWRCFSYWVGIRNASRPGISITLILEELRYKRIKQGGSPANPSTVA